MNWLWQSSETPKDIPQWIYYYLVTTLNISSDLLSPLKCVKQMDFRGDVLIEMVRIFDPEVARKTANIKDFASLDRHPELVLFEGHREVKSGRIDIVKKVRANQI